ncbi:YfcC family protein [Schnuerera ultunensis]|uniref:C4-dicarboxylate anaerobic carrier n=1 Tax=[Clostridium] ultunense Esp TaxID=1288971 RepID=A0A1M4PQA7_9FIRM|nr:TIGR00366 family protein [Schnuerera ultunensis]SHD77672.1 C4-dicarboxylate anaerobic carrier [[Clostridium] ultunense Esp]
MEKSKQSFLFSSPVTTIFMIFILVLLLTYIIPSGKFDREVDPQTGIEVVDGDSFQRIEKNYLGIMEIFGSIHQGFLDASDIIYLCFFSSFYIRVITDSGAFSGAIIALIKKLGNKKNLIIPIFIILISLAGFSYGETEDIYPLIPLFITTANMVGYDAIVGIAISGGAVMIGFAASAFNPYTIGVAQNIAELPFCSGATYRIIIYIVFVTLYILWVMRYAERISNGIMKSYVEDIYFDYTEENMEERNFTFQQKIIMLGLVVVVGFMIYGAMARGWYFKEISALFIMGGLFSSVFLGYSSQKIVHTVVEGFKDIILGVIVIGLARSILVILSEGVIIDTIIYYLYNIMKNLPYHLYPVGMLFIQTILNLFIPSGSGQAAAVMPIMIPLADMHNINRQVAVLAFQMGDGFSNLIWPTAAISVICGIGKIPLERWYKFFLPFFYIMIVFQCIFIIVANVIGYGPF